ncbi:MAG TPA: phosphatase PAP2 family protein [Candidatus Handelsmanbacteria bacterium]|nr:phosphatase PAP2 family protein [Candidatus Handelsmanbacteria bacterium]
MPTDWGAHRPTASPPRLAYGDWRASQDGRRYVLFPLARASSSSGVRALVLANALVLPLKEIVGRERPDGEDLRSFPSGHSANAFAIATILARRSGSGLRVPIYAFAATVPVSRIHEERHFLSDVVVGATLGTIAGWSVTTAPSNDERRLSWTPIYTEGVWMLQTGWRL